jgi:hypothetical protein
MEREGQGLANGLFRFFMKIDSLEVRPVRTYGRFVLKNIKREK